MPEGQAKDDKNNFEFEISFYEKILKERPNFIEALRALAELYTRTGEYNSGLELDKQLVKLLPQDPIVHYNIACSYSLLGDINSSLDAIKKAIDFGYNDFEYMNRDPDLESLRKDKRFEEILFILLRLTNDKRWYRFDFALRASSKSRRSQTR